MVKCATAYERFRKCIRKFGANEKRIQMTWKQNTIIIYTENKDQLQHITTSERSNLCQKRTIDEFMIKT